MKRFSLALLLVILVAGSAHALSDSTYKKMLKDPEFARADKALNQAWKNAKDTLPGDAFNSLRKEQTQWVKKGRDNEVRPLLSTMSRTEAYAVITAKRASYINQYISKFTGGSAVEEEYEDFDIMDDEEDVPITPAKVPDSTKSTAPDTPPSESDNDLPDDLPQDLPDVPDLNDTLKDSDSKSDPKNAAINSQEKAAEILEERLINAGKIAPNETLEYSGRTQINGEECWEFSAQFNFSETGRYAISPTGKIYEHDSENDKFILVK